MIDIRNLTKTYGEKKAVDNLSLRIGAGEMYAFIFRDTVSPLVRQRHGFAA